MWADIDPTTGNISAADVARTCTARTKAILAVHWGGTPCDLEALGAVARHRAHAACYDEVLKGNTRVRAVACSPDRHSAHWLYTVRVVHRARFVEHLRACGVTASRVPVRNDHYSVFAASAGAAQPVVMSVNWDDFYR